MNPLAVVSCADSGQLQVLAVQADGGLQRRQVLEIGGQLMPMAVHPWQGRLYVARRSDPLALITLDVAAPGELCVLGESPLPASMAYLACDRRGRWWMSASYGGDCVAIGPIDAAGLAGPATAVLPTGRHAHSIVPDPANRFVYAAALGADALHRFRLEADTGALRPTEPPTVAVSPGAGPRHLVFDAAGTRLYLLNELDAHIDVLACEPETGALQPLQRVSVWPAGQAGEPWAAEVRLSADGRWLLATERRSNTLSLLAVGSDGLLRLCDRQPVEAQPRGMQISPDGQYVLVAGQTSHHVGSYALDARSGTLRACDRLAVGRNPNWIEFLRPS